MHLQMILMFDVCSRPLAQLIFFLKMVVLLTFPLFLFHPFVVGDDETSTRTGTATDYTVTVRVVKQDAFGPEPARRRRFLFFSLNNRIGDDMN